MANYTDSYSNVHELMWDTFNTSNSSGRDINISSITTSLFPHDSIANDSSFGQNLTSQSPWESLSKAYQRVHGYLAFAVCVFGIISNVLNIIVLTRKHMRSPVNFILTALAIADIMTMSPYTVMAMYLYIINKPECSKAHTEPWMYFVMFHNLFIIACHMMATWLTVSLAVFRYIFVCKHQHAQTMCSMRRSQITVLIVFIVTIVSNTPYLFMYRVTGQQNPATNEFCYWVSSSEFANKNQMFINFVHWLYGVVIKILPCILLAYLSTLIIIAMQKAKKRRARLLNNISRVIDHDSSNEHNRTTMMLVGVVLCFIITEIPQGLVAWISAVDKHFYTHVYFHLGDIMDILVLVNSAVNFILYCIMSKQFRDTFINVFFAACLPRFLHRLKQHPNGGDYTMVHTETTNV